MIVDKQKTGYNLNVEITAFFIVKILFLSFYLKYNGALS